MVRRENWVNEHELHTVKRRNTADVSAIGLTHSVWSFTHHNAGTLVRDHRSSTKRVKADNLLEIEQMATPSQIRPTSPRHSHLTGLKQYWRASSTVRQTSRDPVVGQHMTSPWSRLEEVLEAGLPRVGNSPRWPSVDKAASAAVDSLVVRR